MDSSEKLELLEELQKIQRDIDSCEGMYSYTDEYACLNKLKVLFDYDGHQHHAFKFSGFLDGRTSYTSDEFEEMSQIFLRLSELVYLRDTLKENKERWNKRVIEIKKELGIK